MGNMFSVQSRTVWIEHCLSITRLLVILIQGDNGYISVFVKVCCNTFIQKLQNVIFFFYLWDSRDPERIYHFHFETLQTLCKQQLVEIISWGSPLQLSGQAKSACLFEVCAQHCGKQEGDGEPLQHPRDSNGSTQPPAQLLSSTNLPLLASRMSALLLSPPLFLHPDLLFGDR